MELNDSSLVLLIIGGSVLLCCFAFLLRKLYHFILSKTSYKYEQVHHELDAEELEFKATIEQTEVMRDSIWTLAENESDEDVEFDENDMDLLNKLAEAEANLRV